MCKSLENIIDEGNTNIIQPTTNCVKSTNLT